ncbi:hypothetical protein [Paenibacillus kyungheensis]
MESNKRLREITIKMIKKVESGLEILPLNFSYKESEFLNEKLYFTLHRNMGLKKLNRTEEEIVDLV